MRYYAPWLCRFVSVDPLAEKYAYYTPYQYAGNKPINAIDLDGAESAPVTPTQGQQATAPSRPNTAMPTDATAVARRPLPKAHNVSLSKKLASYRSSDAHDAVIAPAPSLQQQAENRKNAQYNAAMKAGAGTDPLLAGGDGNNPVGLVSSIHTGFREAPLFVLTEGLSLAAETGYTALVLRSTLRTSRAARATEVGGGLVAGVARTSAAETGYASLGGEFVNDFRAVGSPIGLPLLRNSLEASSAGKLLGSFRAGEPIIVNGIKSFSGTVDYVLTRQGELLLGSKHTFMSKGNDVIAAGEITLRRGSINVVDNASGHYLPSVIQAEKFKDAFEYFGFNISKTTFNIYSAGGRIVKTIRPK